MTPSPTQTMRTDLLRFPQPDGGLDVVDLVMDRFHRFSAEEAAANAAGEGAMWARLEALYLTEGEIAQSLRLSQWSARAQGMLARAEVERVADVDWEEAEALPADIVRGRWRRGEALRRAAEERAAGRHVVALRAFLTEEAAQRLREEALALPMRPLKTDIVRGQRCWLGDDDLPTWRAFFHDPLTRRLLGGVLGVSPAPETTINVWRMEPNGEDQMRAHLDGRRYAATFSVGLCPGWRAADGGAIAFGEPQEGGFVVRERWLPLLGDLCLFRPQQTLWHAVEPVTGAHARLTMTGWWMA